MRAALIGLVITACVSIARADSLGRTPQESQALVHLDRGEYKGARRLAEKSLSQKNTFIANFVLGVVHAEGEGNLARGLYYVQRSKEMLLTDEGNPPANPDARRWHKRVLLREQAIYGMMDRRDQQLKVLDEYDAHYAPKLTARRIWPLLKLERFDEARDLGKALVHNDEPVVRERAYNGLMAVEEEAGNRRQSYTWGLEGLKDTRGESCIIATNLALGARRTFQFAKAISHDTTALQAQDGSCPTSPHAQLAAMYLVFGEFQQSLSSLKLLRSTPRPPDMRVQNEMVIRARFVELLLALGALDEALVRARQIIEAPDRAGMVSASAEIVELSNQTLAWSVYSARMHQLEEAIANRSIWDGVSLRLDHAKLWGERWSIGRQALRLGAEPGVLLKTIRPYYTDVMLWYGVDLIQILGHGVVRKLLKEAKAIETDYPAEASRFLDSYRAEMSWREGEYLQAIEQGERLLKDLPAEPKLLRMRIRAWLADAYLAQGNLAAATEHFHRVIDFYPTALRTLEVPLPVQWRAGDSNGQRYLKRLKKSPRFRDWQQSPFTIEARGNPGQVSICLLGQKRYGCVTEASVEDENDVVAATLDLFHDEIFSPSLSLTQSDITSLDGRAIRGSARQAVDALLGHEGTP